MTPPGTGKGRFGAAVLFAATMRKRYAEWNGSAQTIFLFIEEIETPQQPEKGADMKDNELKFD